jgi:hypothetical protein
MPRLEPGTLVDYQDCMWRVLWCDGIEAGIQSAGGILAIRVSLKELGIQPEVEQTKEVIMREMFYSYESGKIIAGLQWEIETSLGTETHECYQYNTLEDVLGAFNAFQKIPGMKVVKLVTHRGGYKGMKTLDTWKKDAPATKEVTQ